MDPLKHIIQSLTPAEKRYFGRFAKTFKTDSELQRLFEAMDNQLAFNQKEIKKATGIVNLTEAKAGLRKLIFKAMRNYREEAGAKHQLRDALSDIDFLMTKGLNEEARKEINKAWKIAEKHEAYKDQAEMLDRLNNINQRTLKLSGDDVEFDALCTHMDEVNRKQQEVYIASLHNRRVGFLINTHQYKPASLSGRDLDKIVTSIKAKLEKVQSPHGRCILLLTVAACYQAVGLEENARETYVNTRALFKKHPSLIDTSPTAYLTCIYNYALLSTALSPKISWGLIQEAERSFLVLKDFFKASPQRMVYQRHRLSIIKLAYCKINGQWQLLGKLESEIKQRMGEVAVKERVVTALEAAGLISCFYEAKNFEKALEWINIYYQLDDAKVLKPLMTCVRVMEVLVYNRNKQFDVSDNRGSNLYKTFIEQKLTGEYYRHLGVLLRKLNHWEQGNACHRKEMEALIILFKGLKDRNDINYQEQSDYYDAIAVLRGLLSD